MLELLNHGDECTEETPSTSSDAPSSLENAKDLLDFSDDEKSVEEFVNNDGGDGIGDEAYGSCDSLDRDESKGDGHFSLSDNDACGDIDDRVTEVEHVVDGGSASDDVKSDELDRDDHEGGEADDEVNHVDAKESNPTESIIRRFSFGDSYHDDSELSSISDANENFEYDEGDVKGYESSSFCSENGSSDNDCFDAVVNSETTVGSEEFESCPNCHELFPLPDLVDHAPKCTGIVSDLNKTIKTATTTGPLSVSPPTDCPTVSYACQFCGMILPENLMSKHYPKCERKNFPRSRGEGSCTVEESDASVLPRLTIEDDWSVHSLASPTKTSSESTDREDSTGLEWISSPYSYYDCEEQCLYCLKMFAVSELVEHACNCASRHEVRYFHENVP